MATPPTPTPDDQHLLSRIRDGDEQAFEQLFLTYYRRLWAFAYDLTHYDKVAEDLVQDVFASLWIRRERLEIEQGTTAYLFGAVRNLAYRHHRHQAVVAKSVTNAAEQYQLGPHMPDPSTQIELSELEARLDAAMALMPKAQREAFVLRWREGLSYQEIARIMQISPSAVSVNIARARKYLRDAL